MDDNIITEKNCSSAISGADLELNAGGTVNVNNTVYFLGGVPLANNMRVMLYKNESIYWLSLYKNDTFINFITYGPEISMLSASPCGYFLAYYQQNHEEHTLDLDIWEYDADEQELHIYTSIRTSLDVSLPIHMAQICFNNKSTHIAGLCEWNHIHIIDLTNLSAHTEFYSVSTELQAPNVNSTATDVTPIIRSRNSVGLEVNVGGKDVNELNNQTIFTGPENYFAWFGQDEYIRIIDVNGPQPIMWQTKLLTGKKNANYNQETKYCFEFCGLIIFMTNNGNVMLCKPDLQDKCIRAEYNINYPIKNCLDISIIDGKTLCFHLKNKNKTVITVNH